MKQWIEETRNKIPRPSRLERDLSTLTNLDIMRKIKFQERSEGKEGMRAHACGIADKGLSLSLSLLVWVGWVE